ncbi:hypothetical protein V5O48_017677 [Marasmius crinis-equi]|uniref:Uncharacterized protein n=1 Tax=Marasmius crinis-equi TaxID=585013 RepID=A0ABR3ENC4_9AGAR
MQMEICEDHWQFVVPKLHIQGHRRPCQERFSLHLLPGAGQTDGEGIERQWASLGPIGTCTKEQGPGHRRETIDDHLGWWNWNKVITLGFLLRKRRCEARIQVRTQTEFFNDFSESQADNIEQWKAMVEAWENRTSDEEGIPNPYSQVDQGLNEQDMQLHYATEEASLGSDSTFLQNNVSPSAFLMFGLEIEDQQRRLKLDLQDGDSKTTLQQTALLKRRAKILRNIAKLHSLQ